MTVPTLRKLFAGESAKRNHLRSVHVLLLAALGLLCLWVLGVEHGAAAFLAQAEWVSQIPGPLLNSLLIVAGAVPILYFVASRPLVRLVKGLQRCESSLREELASVVATVKERESDLESVTRALQEEVASGKRRDEELQYQTDRFRSLIENSLDGITLLDAEGQTLYVSPAASRILGLAPEQLIGRNIFERVHRDHHLDVSEHLARLREKDHCITTAQVRMIRADGSWRWIEAVGWSLLSEPSVQAIVVNWRDITERREAEEALEASESRYRGLASNIPGVIFQLSMKTDGSLSFPFVSDGAYALFGASPRAIMADASAVFKRVHEDDLQVVYSSISQSAAYLESAVAEIRVRHENGDIIWVRAVASPQIEPDGGVLWNGVIVDITQRKRGEEALLESERKIRQLASQSVKAQEEELQWVADSVHDRVAQDLVAVYQQLQVLKSLVPATPEAQRVVSRVLEMQQKTISEVRSIMKDLFSPALDIFGLVPVIEEELRHFQDDSGCRAVLRADYQLRPPKYVESSLYRIFHEAMANIGRHCAESREVEVSLTSLPEGVSLQVKDDGPGFDVETAVLGRGSGGLSTMRRRAEIIGGTFEISSGEDLGTTLTVRIPGKYMGHPEDDRL